MDIYLDVSDNELLVGVVGYSTTPFDEEEAKQALEDIFDDIEDNYIETGDFETIAVVSGLTNMGIPKLAYELADARGYRTVGLAPEVARDLDLYNVDEIVFVGQNWGDESQTFIDNIDILVRVGGGEQATAETQMADDEQIPVFEYDL